MIVPGLCEFCAQRLARQRQALGRPLLKTLVEQRQVEQPFAGIIDDVEREAAIRAVLPLVVDDEPQLADIGGRVRPAPFLDQRADVVLVVEARHRIVGLRLEPRVGDPPGGIGLEHRKAAAAGQAVDQRGDEHGLAGARQPGDAEPDGRIEQAVAIIPQRPRRQPRLLDNVLETGSHAAEWNPAMGAIAKEPPGKVAIAGPKSSVIVFDAIGRSEPFVDLVKPMIYRFRGSP